MTKIPYAERLKDPRWQKKRLEVLNRDNFSCTLCGDAKTTLHVHHLVYGKTPWDTDNDSLTTYCKLCHIFVENFKKNRSELILCEAFKIPFENQYCILYLGIDTSKSNKKELIIATFDDSEMLVSYSFSEHYIKEISKFLSFSENLTNGKTQEEYR